MNTLSISLKNSARAVVTLETKGSRIVYSTYISDHGVTLDTVGEHVAALAELAVSMRAIDADDKDDVKRFKNKIRNGLNTHLGKVVPSKKDDDVTNLLTADGVSLFADWVKDGGKMDDVIHAIAAEVERRAAKK